MGNDGKAERKEEIFRRAEAVESDSKGYDPRDMNCSRMPFGCWVWMLAVLTAISLFLKRACE